MRKAYARWAPVYDRRLRQVPAEPAARAAVEAATACGPRILEAGVGTGLVARLLPGDAEVYGVDLSEHMLRSGPRPRSSRAGLSQVKSLQVMDVYPARLRRRDASMRSRRSSSSPWCRTRSGALAEFARVLKPGGEIVLANHFGQTDGPSPGSRRRPRRLVQAIGWSSDFKVARVEAWARAHGAMEVVELKPLFPAGLFKLMRLRKAGLRRAARSLTPRRAVPISAALDPAGRPAWGGVAQLVRAEES